LEGDILRGVSEIEKNDPFFCDGNEREGELTAIQTAFSADPWLRIRHAVSKVYWEDSDP